MQKELTVIVFIVVGISIFLVMLSAIVINLLLVTRNRKLQHNNDLLFAKNQFELELSKSKIEVNEQTLTDVARDLHDDIGQMLTFNVLQLHRIKSEDVKIQSAIITVKESIQGTLQAVRNISKSLSGDYISKFGIRNALMNIAERCNKQGIVNCTIDFEEKIKFNSKPNELFAFRIVQELINNTIKHAEANSINIKLSEENNCIAIHYEDDGIGFNVEEKMDGMGLINLEKRVGLMNGTLTFKSSTGNGFSAIITFQNLIDLKDEN